MCSILQGGMEVEHVEVEQEVMLCGLRKGSWQEMSNGAEGRTTSKS